MLVPRYIDYVNLIAQLCRYLSGFLCLLRFECLCAFVCDAVLIVMCYVALHSIASSNVLKSQHLQLLIHLGSILICRRSSCMSKGHRLLLVQFFYSR